MSFYVFLCSWVTTVEKIDTYSGPHRAFFLRTSCVSTFPSGGQMRPPERSNWTSGPFYGCEGLTTLICTWGFTKTHDVLLSGCTYTADTPYSVWGYPVTHKWSKVRFFWRSRAGYERGESKKVRVEVDVRLLGRDFLHKRQALAQATTRERVWEVCDISGGPGERLGLARVATNVYWAACMCWCHEP